MSVPGENLRAVGGQGEDVATDWLREQGVGIVDRNWFWRGGELDLICREDEKILFVEVKYRRSARMGSAAAAVTRQKQQHIIRSAKAWLKRNGGFNRPIRFDVVTVTGTGPHPECRWYKSAFRPER